MVPSVRIVYPFEMSKQVGDTDVYYGIHQNIYSVTEV